MGLHPPAVDRRHLALLLDLARVAVVDVALLAAQIDAEHVQRIAWLVADSLNAVDVVRRQERVDRAATENGVLDELQLGVVRVAAIIARS